jgi:hypothetical protein
MDISEVCNLCNKPNDQMLMLKCVHDPCINCAASTYAEQIHIKGQSSQVKICLRQRSMYAKFVDSRQFWTIQLYKS